MPLRDFRIPIQNLFAKGRRKLIDHVQEVCLLNPNERPFLFSL
jgi:hypothetical protein